MKNRFQKPKFAASGIAAVPYRDKAHCVQVILENFPEAPFLPVMTRGIRWMLEGIPCLVINREKKRITMAPPEEREEELLEFYDRVEQGDLNYFATTPKTAPFYEAMIDAIRQNPPPELKWILVQSAGPVLLGDMLKQEANGKPCIFHETLRDVLIKGINMKCKWLEIRIKEDIPGVEVVIDQPETTLVNFTSAGGSGNRDDLISAINEGFVGLTCPTFIHCCANIDWSLLTDTNADVINFDAYQHAVEASLYAREFRRFIEDGGMIGWGIVPVIEDLLEKETFQSLVEKLEKAIDGFVKAGIDEELLASSSWVLPCCETVLLTEDQSDRVFHLTREISERMRSKYGFSSQGNG